LNQLRTSIQYIIFTVNYTKLLVIFVEELESIESL